MNSDSVKKLLPALAKAIADMPNPQKNKKNEHFKNRYADLGEVLDCVAGPLEANGLLLTQVLEGVDLFTIVWHAESGEFLRSRMTLRPEKDTPQGFASAMTYARRYAIKALFCMADDDDDGNGASRPKTTTAPAQQAKPAPRAEAVQPFEFAEEAVQAIERCSTSEQLRIVGNRIASSGNITGTDADIVRSAYKTRMQDIKESK